MASASPDRHQRRVEEPGGGAVHDHGVLRDSDVAGTEDQPPRLDPRQVAEPYDVVDRAQQVELPRAQRGRLRHRRRHGSVDAQHHARFLEVEEHVVRCRCPRGRLHGVRCHADEDAGSGCTMARLSIHGSRGRTQQIGVRVHPVAEQPHAGVGRGLAGADDHELGRRSPRSTSSWTGTTCDPVGHPERRRGRRRDQRREIAGVDHACIRRGPGAPDRRLARRTALGVVAARVEVTRPEGSSRSRSTRS